MTDTKLYYGAAKNKASCDYSNISRATAAEKFCHTYREARTDKCIEKHNRKILKHFIQQEKEIRRYLQKLIYLHINENKNTLQTMRRSNNFKKMFKFKNEISNDY